MGKEASSGRVVGRYVLHEEFASGGMASVHFGRLIAEGGFSRVVAIKRLHPQHAKDPSFVAMLLDEARLAARVRHPNVALVLDVVATDGEVFLVMEYVHGEPLSGLTRLALERGGPIPARIVSSVTCGLLQGLDAAHRATSETGEPLGVVHRDVSPENVIVGVDGVARVLDFGVALARGRSQITREGSLKGKLGYMAPELLEGKKATPLSDVYSAGVVLWEMLVGKRLFTGGHEGVILAKVLRGNVPRPSSSAPLPLRVDEVVLRAISRDPADRYPSAYDFAVALEACLKPAPTREVGAWVEEIAALSLAKRAELLAIVESQPTPQESIQAPVAIALEAAPGIPSLMPDEEGPGQRTERMVGKPPEIDVLPRPTHPIPPRSKRGEAPRSRRTRLFVIGALTGATFVIGIALGTHYAGSHAAVAAPVSAPASASSPSIDAPAPTASAAAVATEDPSPALAPPDVPEAPTASATAASVSAPVRSVPSRGGHGGPRKDCNPPFRIDERGIRHLKPECL